jgi:ribosomal-protein-alanine N-acetyltransferase
MMSYEELPIVVVRMTPEDVPAILEIEHASFPTPWPASAYRRELTENDMARYFILVPREAAHHAPHAPGLAERLSRWLLGLPRNDLRPILGYTGYWLMAGEAHISTLAVAPEWRGRGLGELLLLHLIEAALADEATLVTLEVRVSNEPAQALYEKYGFDYVGRRKRYYHDNNEDAHIMTVEPIQVPEYQALLDQRRAELLGRLASLAVGEVDGYSQ